MSLELLQVDDFIGFEVLMVDSKLYAARPVGSEEFFSLFCMPQQLDPQWDLAGAHWERHGEVLLRGVSAYEKETCGVQIDVWFVVWLEELRHNTEQLNWNTQQLKVIVLLLTWFELCVKFKACFPSRNCLHQRRTLRHSAAKCRKLLTDRGLNMNGRRKDLNIGGLVEACVKLGNDCSASSGCEAVKHLQFVETNIGGRHDPVVLARRDYGVHGFQSKISTRFCGLHFLQQLLYVS